MSDPNWKSMTQRSGSSFNAGHTIRSGMFRHWTTFLANSLKFFDLEEAAVGKAYIKRFGGMSFAQNETVSVWLFRAFGIETH